MGKVIRGPFDAFPQPEVGETVAVMTSNQARSFHWLRIREEYPFSATNRALCGARPSGWIGAWALAIPDTETTVPRTPGSWRYAPQVEACTRCEAKKD